MEVEDRLTEEESMLTRMHEILTVVEERLFQVGQDLTERRCPERVTHRIEGFPAHLQHIEVEELAYPFPQFEPGDLSL